MRESSSLLMIPYLQKKGAKINYYDPSGEKDFFKNDIYENSNEGGQAPHLIYKQALLEGFSLHERIDTTVCLIKN